MSYSATVSANIGEKTQNLKIFKIRITIGVG